MLYGLLRLFGRFETQGKLSGIVTANLPQLVVAGLLASGGLLGLAAHGFTKPADASWLSGPVPWVALTGLSFLLAGRHVPVAKISTWTLGHALALTEATRIRRAR